MPCPFKKRTPITMTLHCLYLFTRRSMRAGSGRCRLWGSRVRGFRWNGKGKGRPRKGRLRRNRVGGLWRRRVRWLWRERERRLRWKRKRWFRWNGPRWLWRYRNARLWHRNGWYRVSGRRMRNARLPLFNRPGAGESGDAKSDNGFPVHV